jgi:hydrogenase maturation protease
MRKVIVLGWGNSQRQDDGLARIALERLELAGLPPDVEFVHADQLLPEHAAIASQADVLMFVDASKTGRPGEIRVEKVFADGKFPGPSHHLSPAALLTLLQTVYGSAPEAYCATLRGDAFEFGEGLSPSIELLLPLFVDEIARIVRERMTVLA